MRSRLMRLLRLGETVMVETVMAATSGVHSSRHKDLVRVTIEHA
jgi:hypothetical protein